MMINMPLNPLGCQKAHEKTDFEHHPEHGEKWGNQRKACFWTMVSKKQNRGNFHLRF